METLLRVDRCNTVGLALKFRSRIGGASPLYDVVRISHCLSNALFIVLLLMGTLAYAAGVVVTDPTGIAPDRHVYYPGTEALGEDEIRIVACGTGMPASRHGQAAASC